MGDIPCQVKQDQRSRIGNREVLYNNGDKESWSSGDEERPIAGKRKL